MRSWICRCGVVALLLGLCLQADAASKWTRLKTDHFLFVGDASEREIRQVAQHLEQFRDVMSLLLPPAAVRSPTPTVVFVFQTDKAFTPYKPRFGGHPVDVAGYFLARGDANYVAINGELSQAALGIVFHEYTHFLVENTAGNLPLWANEGVAGVYETLEVRNGGSSAVIGMPHEDHLTLLGDHNLMPLTELMAVDIRSPVYNEGSRRGVFYAESWALMHYLMLGNPARAAQLGDWLTRVKSGLTPGDAFKEAFGGDLDGLERELREYIRRPSFPSRRMDFDEKVLGAAAGHGAVLDEVDANVYLGDLLSRLDREDEALGQLKRLVEANPTSAHAVSTLGLFELRAGKADEALPLLERAATLDPADAAVQRAWGRVLYARSQERHGGDSSAGGATIEKARAVLNRAVELSPGDPETLETLGRLESEAGDHARATTLFERAVSVAPTEERYRLMLADSLVRQGEYTRATTYLGPLVASATDPRVRNSARSLLAFVGTERMRASDPHGQAGDGNTARAAAPPSSGRPTATGGRFIPSLRPVGAGERRVLGMFTAVNCRPGSIVLVIEADTGAVRISTDDLTTVDFISYRGATPQSVGCGLQQPASRVFATFTEVGASAAVGVDGRALAIELLPDDFAPK